MTLYVLVTGDPVPSVRERRGTFVDLFREAIGDACSAPIVAIDCRLPLAPLPGDASALVVTGSSAHVPDRAPWVLEGEDFLRDAVRAGVPTLGVCFGHQMLGQGLGGRCVRNPRGREIGTLAIERLAAAASDPLFGEVPDSFQANVTHLDTVSELPPGAVALARTAQEDHHAIRFGETTWGVQFHPEIDRDVMCGYLEARREVLTTEGRDVEALLGEARETPTSRAILQRFVRMFVRAG
jgi:GMP synthase (glutamine-hydrolysing)